MISFIYRIEYLFHIISTHASFGQESEPKLRYRRIAIGSITTELIVLTLGQRQRVPVTYFGKEPDVMVI